MLLADILLSHPPKDMSIKPVLIGHNCRKSNLYVSTYPVGLPDVLKVDENTSCSTSLVLIPSSSIVIIHSRYMNDTCVDVSCSVSQFHIDFQSDHAGIVLRLCCLLRHMCFNA